MPKPDENAPAPVVNDYIEDEGRLRDVRTAQSTAADLLWYACEYAYKNETQPQGFEFSEDERESYGFNREAIQSEDDEQMYRTIVVSANAKATSGTLEDYKNYLRAMGSMKARSVVLNGKYYDMIEKALGEDTPDLDDKAYYLLHLFLSIR